MKFCACWNYYITVTWTCLHFW